LNIFKGKADLLMENYGIKSINKMKIGYNMGNNIDFIAFKGGIKDGRWKDFRTGKTQNY
jgi:hypothetical protein